MYFNFKTFLFSSQSSLFFTLFRILFVNFTYSFSFYIYCIHLYNLYNLCFIVFLNFWTSNIFLLLILCIYKVLSNFQPDDEGNLEISRIKDVHLWTCIIIHNQIKISSMPTDHWDYCQKIWPCYSTAIQAYRKVLFQSQEIGRRPQVSQYMQDLSPHT